MTKESLRSLRKRRALLENLRLRLRAQPEKLEQRIHPGFFLPVPSLFEALDPQAELELPAEESASHKHPQLGQHQPIQRSTTPVLDGRGLTQNLSSSNPESLGEIRSDESVGLESDGSLASGGPSQDFVPELLYQFDAFASVLTEESDLGSASGHSAPGGGGGSQFVGGAIRGSELLTSPVADGGATASSSAGNSVKGTADAGGGRGQNSGSDGHASGEEPVADVNDTTTNPFATDGESQSKQVGDSAAESSVHALTSNSPRQDEDSSFAVDRGFPANPAQTIALGFDNGLGGWDSIVAGGSDEGKGSVRAGSAILTEGDSFLVGVETAFEIPAENKTLQFTFTELNFDTTDPDSINDAFEASLTDDEGRPLVHTIGQGLDAFFNITEGEPVALGSSTQYAAGTISTVTIDLSDVPVGSSAKLNFRLVNNDQDTTTSVRILDVVLPGVTDEPPSITTELLNDTAPVGSPPSLSEDRLTNDPRLVGTVDDDNGITKLEAQIDGGAFIEITGNLNGNSYEYDPGNLAIGAHTILLRATDTGGQTSDVSILFEVNAPPVANAGDDQTVEPGAIVQLDASGSSDSEAALYSYLWQLPDGRTSSSVSPSFEFSGVGTFPVTLTVTDTAGSTASDSVTVTVEAAQPVDVTNLVEVTYSRPQVNARRRMLSFYGTVRNTSSKALLSPMKIHWSNLTSNITPLNADGVNADGSHYFEISFDGESLEPGQSTEPKLMVLQNVTLRAYSFDTTVTAVVGDERGEGEGESAGDQNESSQGTKFYVVDAEADRTFRYTADGSPNGDFALLRSSTDPRGATSNVQGNTVWVIDGQSHEVTLQSPSGSPLGQWRAEGLDDPQGIATDGKDIWIVDAGSDSISYFEDGASVLAGAMAPTAVLKLDSLNTNPSGIATDGERIWVTDDSEDSVFVYGRGGLLVGSWGMDPRNDDAAGITNDPSGMSESLWIVDREDDAIYSYSLAASATSGSIAASIVPLAEGNQAAEGIADPPIDLSVQKPSSGSQLEERTTVLVTGSAVPGDSSSAVAQVTINGNPVDALDAAGNFFGEIEVSSGANSFPVVAINEVGETTTETLDFAGVSSLETLSALDGNVAGLYGRTSYNTTQRILYADLAISNEGVVALGAPLLVGIANISNSRVRLREANGTTKEGLPYVEFSSLALDQILASGESTSSKQISFFNPESLPFSYDLTVLGQLNRAPQFTGIPKVETAAGQEYVYNATAQDVDRDTIEYSLLVGPAGAVLDRTSGRMGWLPSAADLGTHSVVLEASDGNGGRDEQRFTISVIDAPPNRPPVIASVPVVDGLQNVEYEYQIIATDADGDPTEFQLANGPVGMELDGAGLLTWTPNAAQVGDSSVEVNVTDSNGAFAAQNFVIRVIADQQNASPIFRTDDSRIFVPFVEIGDSVGEVSPTLITRSLLPGESEEFKVRLSLPPVSTPKADVFLLFDDSGSFANVAPSLIEIFPEVIENLLINLPEVDFGFGVGRFEDYSNFADERPEGRPFILNHPITDGFSLEPNGTVDTTTLGYAAISAALQRTAPGGGGDPPETLVEGLYQVATGVGFDGNGDGDTVDSGPAGALTTQLTPNSSGDVPAINSYEVDPGNDILPLIGSRGGVGFRTSALPIILAATDIGTAYEPEFVDPIIGKDGLPIPLAEFASNPALNTRGSTPGGRGAGIQETVDALNNLGALVIGLGTESIPGPFEFGPKRPLEAFAKATGAISVSELPIASGIPGDPIESGDPIFFQLGTLQAEDVAAGITNAIASALTATDFGLELVPSVGSAPVSIPSPELDGVKPGDEVEFAFTLSGASAPSAFDLLFVREGNNAILGSIPVALNSEWRYSADAIDPEGDEVAYTLITGPSDAAIDASSGDISWIPTSAGEFEFQVLADDGNGGFSVRSFLAVVGSDLPSEAPQVNSTPGLQAYPTRKYQYQISASDEDGDRLTFLLSKSPGGMSVDRNSGLIEWTPTELQLGEQQVEISVLDGRGGVGSQKFSIDVTDAFVNEFPVITSTPSVGAIAGEAYVYQAVAKDGNGDPVLYDLPVAPEGMTVNEDTGEIVWEPTDLQSGVRDVILRVRDGFGGFDIQSFQLLVSGENSPPVVVSSPLLKAEVLRPYSYSPRALDPNGDAVTFRLGVAPDGMDIDAVNGAITWIPDGDQLGPNLVKLIIEDDRGGIAEQTYVVEVSGELPNRPPEITSEPRAEMQADFKYRYLVQATDPNLDPLTYSLSSGPNGMTIDENTGLLEWEPTVEQIGEHIVQLEVADGRGGIATQQFTLRIGTININTAPSLVSDPPQTATVDILYQYDVKASDTDGDVLIFRLLEGPEGSVIDSLSGELIWTPSIEQLGLQRITVEVLDGQGGTATQSFDVLVRSTNVPPTITSVPGTLAYADATYRYQVIASDPEGGKLDYILSEAPDGMEIDPNSGLLSWDAAPFQLGNHSVAILVLDQFGAGIIQSYTLRVEAFRPNTPPTISSTPTISTLVEQPYSYLPMATDTENDAISFELSVFPDGATIDRNSGLIEWTPDSNQLGSAAFTLVATDALGATATQAWSLEIREDNFAPQFLGTPLSSTSPSARYESLVQATDPDGDPITFSLVAGPGGLTVDASGRIEWFPTEDDLGERPVSIRASDPYESSILDFDLFVGADLNAPTVSIVTSVDGPVLQGDIVKIVVAASDDVAVLERGLTINGVPIVLSADGSASLPTDQVGSLELVATAADAAGNEGVDRLEVFVSDPSDITAPSIAISSPAREAVLTSIVDIVGRVTDDDGLVRSIDVYAAPFATGVFTNIGRKEVNAASFDGVLAKFDPSMLSNDVYTIRVIAEDTGGNIGIEEFDVSVEGELKIGQFSLSFTDLTIPVSGVPITVTRTYDSFESERQDDLGFGWRLEILDTDLRTNVPESGLEEYEIYNAYFNGARTYVNVPGEGRLGFTFRPVLTNSFLGLWAPRFEPDAGNYASLSVPNASLLRTSDGSFVSFGSSLSYNPSSSAFGGKFTLTTKEGLSFEIDGKTGDTRQISDRSANTLTFSDSGIISSTGKSVDFERDPQGRISAVIDPNGNRVEYRYDAIGNLVSVTDREGNETQLIYDQPGRDHYLTGIVDPLGRTGLRSEYDAEGRLVRMIDADGQAIDLTHDLESSTEIVRDQLGNTSVFTYDSQGNVAREVDAEGNTTLRSYDAVGNTLSERIIVGEDDNTTTDPNDPSDVFTVSTFDARGNSLTETDALGNVTRYTYDGFGNVLSTTDPLGNATINAYDSVGNLTSTTDANGLVTSFAYDSSGNPLSLTLPGGQVQSFAYDGSGNLTRQTDAEGAVTIYSYDSNGNQLTETRSQTLADGSVLTVRTENEYDAESRLRFTRLYENGELQRESETRYDALGNRVAEIDPLGRITRFIYDDRGLLTETIFPDDTPADETDNPRAVTEYDNAGQTVATIDELNRRTEFVYDKAGRQIRTIFPDGSMTETVYDEAGRTIAEIDELGKQTRFVYDAVGRQIETILPDASPEDLSDNPRLESSYDSAGRSVAQTDPLGNVTEYVYDDAGRQVETLFADGTSSQSVFDDAGRMAARIDQNGIRTDYEYDSLGRLTAVILPAVLNPERSLMERPRTEYEYDEAGNLLVQRDALGRETKYEYDGQGRRIGTTLPLGQRSSSTYDAVGNSLTVTDFNGDTIRYEYDARNRLIAKRFPDGTSVSMSYTDNGLRESVTDLRGVTRYEYDLRDRLISRTDPDDVSISYTYDAASNRTSLTIPSGTTSFTFDAQNRLESVIDPDGDTTTYTYDAASNLIRTDFPNATIETREYDSLNRLTFLENQGPSGVINSFLYTLDEAGNRLSVEEADGRRVDYSYDDHYRLLAEDIVDAVNGNRLIEYEYDLVGNRLLRDDSGEGITSYEYDENDRLLLETLAGDSTRYEYDANGNTIRKTEAATNKLLTEYLWDYENRLAAADTDGDGIFDVTNNYNVDGIRVSQAVETELTRFLVDANRPYAQVLEEYTSGGVLKASYVHGLDLILQNRHGDAGKSFYHVDGLGSTRALSDALGSVTDGYIYGAFGNTIRQVGSTGNVYLFAGEQRDSTLGLDYLRARYMNPSMARFMSKDSFEGFRNNPISLHKYLYGNSNPVNMIDPSGQFSLLSVVAGLGIVTTLATLSTPTFAAVTGPELKLKLRILVLEQAPSVFKPTVNEMKKLYKDTAKINVSITSKKIKIPKLAGNKVHAGDCRLAMGIGSFSLSPDQQLLFGSVSPDINRVDVFFVNSVSSDGGPLKGCAEHPVGHPGAVVGKKATKWTLAHEVGHVLGLRHVTQKNNLMGPNTSNISGTPKLDIAQVKIMRVSPLTQP